MVRIYRLEDSTLYLCNTCLDDLGPVPGKWNETPLEQCSVCGDVDLQSQEEMDAYHHDMSNLQWEEEQFASDQEMWEAHIRDPHGVKL